MEFFKDHVAWRIISPALLSLSSAKTLSHPHLREVITTTKFPHVFGNSYSEIRVTNFAQRTSKRLLIRIPTTPVSTTVPQHPVTEACKVTCHAADPPRPSKQVTRARRSCNAREHRLLLRQLGHADVNARQKRGAWNCLAGKNLN